MVLAFGLFSSHAEFQLFIIVHAKHADGRATDIRFADDVDAFPTEMLIPAMLAWMKQRSE